MRLILATGSLLSAMAALGLTRLAHRLTDLGQALQDASIRRAAPSTAPTIAERILLASIAGMAICALWIGISWRAGSW